MTGHVKHRIRWFARVGPCAEAPDGWLPRTAVMRGSWGWDVRCLTCQQETRTGGGTERWLRQLIWEHKNEFTSLGSWYPMEQNEKQQASAAKPA